MVYACVSYRGPRSEEKVLSDPRDRPARRAQTEKGKQMPWQNNGGGNGPWGTRGGGGGGGPWGRGGGSGGPQGPDLEDLIRKGQDNIKRMMPGGFSNSRGIAILVFIAIIGWLATGFYRVEPGEQGVALVFGKHVASTDPGLRWNFPAPIGQVFKPNVRLVNRVEVGFQSMGRNDQLRNKPQESLMLTGDENIIDIQFTVFWLIQNAEDFLFNVRNPEETVKNVAESAMREVIGRTNFEIARTQGRAQIQQDAQVLIQKILNDYGAGILVQQVNLQKVDPPATVIDAFRDVQAARADRESAINEAQAYRNALLERALGDANKAVRDAEAFKEEKVNEASGETQRYIQVYTQYREARDVVSQRLFLETMETVLKDMDKILIDGGNGGGNSGTVPYLSLNELLRSQAGAAAGSAARSSGTTNGPSISTDSK